MSTVQEILQEINEIFKDVLDNNDIIVYNETTAEDIAEWDSLSHIQLVVAIEKHFKIRFTAAEISSFNNVGEMCHGILHKTAAK